MTESANGRRADVPVDPMFLDRWSPRALGGEMPDEHAQTLLEAMRWSPSCYNEQPWVVIWATAPEDRQRILGCLVEFNQSWAKDAPFLAVVCARTQFRRNGKDNAHHAFDAGAAWMSLALQAEKLGYRTHAMAGFDAAAVHDRLGLPRDGHVALAVVAVGRQLDAATLPEEIRAKESVSERDERATFAHPGAYRA